MDVTNYWLYSPHCTFHTCDSTTVQLEVYLLISLTYSSPSYIERLKKKYTGIKFDIEFIVKMALKIFSSTYSQENSLRSQSQYCEEISLLIKCFAIWFIDIIILKVECLLLYIVY